MKSMKVGILGSGDVGKSFARGFGALGHEVMIGSRSPEKLSEFVSGQGKHVSSGSFAQVCDAFGWGMIDLGGIEASRHLEPMCMVWVLHGVLSGSWVHAFKMLHK